MSESKALTGAVDATIYLQSEQVEKIANGFGFEANELGSISIDGILGGEQIVRLTVIKSISHEALLKLLEGAI